MTDPIVSYDEVSDSLYISFLPGEMVTGIELNEHILLRVDTREWRLAGLTLLDYSVLAQPTELGPRSLPLPGLLALPSDVQKKVLDLLRTPSVSEFLSLSLYTPSTVESVPIVSLQPAPLTPV